MSAIEKLIDWAEHKSISASVRPIPLTQAARAELVDLRLKVADRNEWQDVATTVATERDQLLQSTAAMRDELERVKGELKQVLDDVLIALAGAGVPTPERTYTDPLARPWIRYDIDQLRKQRDQLRTQLAEAKAELKEECQLVDSETVKRRLAEGQLAELRTGLSVKDEMLKEHVQQLADQSADILKLREQRGQLSGVALNFKQFLMLNGVGMNAEQRERVIQNISNIISEIKTP